MQIGAELKLGHNFPLHVVYAGTWAKMLKDDHFKISRVATNAQKINSLLLGVERKIDLLANMPVSNITTERQRFK